MMQKMKRWIAVVMLVGLVAAFFGLTPAAGAAETGSLDGDWVYNQDAKYNLNTYYYYNEKYLDAARPNVEHPVDLTQEFELVESEYSKDDEGNLIPSGTKILEEQYEGIEGSEGTLFVGGVGETITFTLEVQETGLYSLEMDYYPLATKSAQYLFSLKLDGETPFVEANSCTLSRVYQNEPIRSDDFGDDLRPQQTQMPEWRTQYLMDQNGVYGNLKFYLEKGTRKITLCFDGTPILLRGMTFKQEPYVKSYQEYLTMNKDQKATENYLEVFQAENYYRQSSAMLWPSADRSSSLTQPYSYKNVKINYGGGSQWKQPGHWITWEVTAPESGFYNIGCKYKQGYLDGLFSSRKIYIDGEVPFKELSAVRFNYSSSWTNQVLGDENGAYSIYLEKGTHYITMENVIGDLSDTMSVLQTVVNNLNELYLSIVMITSSSPDPNRDYDVLKQLPTLPDDFRKNAELLFKEAERLEGIVGQKGAENAYFEDVAYNLQTYADNIVDLTYKGRLTNFKNDINGLSAKLTAYQEQALDLDYIALLSPGMEMERATMNFWQWLVFQVKSFFYSFKVDRSAQSDENTIRVWVSGGIDQYEILRNLIKDGFTKETGIEVNLELAGGSLINALAAGTGPDVMLGQGSTTVVNLALRGAVVDLSEFKGHYDSEGNYIRGYFEVLEEEEYIKGSEIPFMLEGRYYGMPSTNGCTVMFVRTDILDSMGLKAPETWDEMYDVAQVLQRYNMNLGAAPSFATLLYQNGGSYFNEDLTEVCFDSDIAVKALEQHAEFFTKYGFPVSYDFTNRFRTGEMPIGLADYTLYNSLKYTAPEISGLWEMVPMPGTRQADGTINATQMDQSGVGAIMLKNKEKGDDISQYTDEWKLIEWWSRAETQARYANDLEAALGIAARRATASLKALDEIGWTNKERATLLEQFKNLQFIPIVPGNYYVSRGLTNSTRGVIDHGENARELLSEWTIKINAEILRKRNEFNLNN